MPSPDFLLGDRELAGKSWNGHDIPGQPRVPRRVTPRELFLAMLHRAGHAQRACQCGCTMPRRAATGRPVYWAVTLPARPLRRRPEEPNGSQTRCTPAGIAGRADEFLGLKDKLTRKKILKLVIYCQWS